MFEERRHALDVLAMGKDIGVGARFGGDVLAGFVGVRSVEEHASCAKYALRSGSQARCDLPRSGVKCIAIDHLIRETPAVCRGSIDTIAEHQRGTCPRADNALAQEPSDAVIGVQGENQIAPADRVLRMSRAQLYNRRRQ